VRKVLSFVFGMVALATLAGCATPARVEQMTIAPENINRYAAVKPLTKKVGVAEVSGGEETNPLWTSEIGDKEFQGALQKSLLQANLLAPEGKGDYLLAAKLLKVDQPMFGFNLTVNTEVKYTLTRVADGKVVFDKTVSASHTATPADAFVAVERLRLANEGAARNNIADIVDSLYALDVKVAKVTLR
jgi:hypothetical protein